MLSGRETRAVGAYRITIDSVDNQRLSSLRQDVSRMRAGYVVYVPVETKDGMSTVRFESLGKGHASEEVVIQTKISASDFRKFLIAGAQPDAGGIRDRLKRELVPATERDSGKTVFFKDLDFFGIDPPALGETDVVVSSELPRAAANLKWLQTTTQPDGKYVGIFGYPRTEAEYKNVFGDATTFGKLEEWQKHRAEADDIARQFGLKILEAPNQDAAAAKAAIFTELENADGIVFVVAHASHCTITLPSGQNISITPGDIEELKLKNNPFVILRVCQDSDHGFADAFLKAGARGVWLNRGIVGADVANRQIAAFLKELRAGKTIAAAIRQVRSTDTHAATATHLMAENQEPENGNLRTGRSELVVGVKR